MSTQLHRGAQLRLRALPPIRFYERGAPRALYCSCDGTIVCVGLKDGRVLVYASGSERDKPPKLLETEPNQASAAGIRALCDVTQRGEKGQRWLVGRIGGQVDWLHIDATTDKPKAKLAGAALTGDSKSPNDHISCIARLDDHHVIVSHCTPDPKPDGTYCVIYRVEENGLVEPRRFRCEPRGRGGDPRRAERCLWETVGGSLCDRN